MAKMSTSLPPNIVHLKTACSRLNSNVNLMGVVTEFLPSKRSGGTDWMSTFTLTDLSYGENSDQGLKIRFFRPMESELPVVQGTGDVVLLRFMKISKWQGMTIGISNKGTSWVVFPAASIPVQAPAPAMQLPYSIQPQALPPGDAEFRYAVTLCNSRDRTTFTQPIPIPTNHSGAPSSSVAASASAGPKGKFSLIKDLSSDTFCDLVGQVVKLYTHVDRAELYLTDHTSNPLLWNYEWGQNEDEESGRDGDVYNYAPRQQSNRQWPGPFGKLTLTVTLWPPHSYQTAKEGDFVFLRNVHIKFSKDSKLEGVMHTDRRYEDRIDVSILKNNEDDDRVKDILRRKRDYMRKFQQHSEAFVNEARGVKRKAEREAKPPSKSAQRKKRKQERERDEVVNGKANDREQNKDNKHDTPIISKDHGHDKVSLLRSQKLDLNKNIHCSNHLVIPRSLSAILSLDGHVIKTPEGTSYTLPFQNINSRATVKVIDYFPPNLVDFAVPCSTPSEFACLSDGDDSQSGDEQLSQGSDTGSQGSVEERRWEWRFGLVLEDASDPKSSNKETIKVYIADQDAECLLKLDAENLSSSPRAVAQLREKLFLLWGDLEERKKRKSTSLTHIDGNARPGKEDEGPKSKAFQCCLKEYGVRTKMEASIEGAEIDSEEDQEGNHNWTWQRRWRMFGTTIT